MLSDEQIEEAVILILECETYNALKERLKHITAKYSNPV